MGKFLVGLGLVTMLSAVAFFGMIAGDGSIPVSQVNGASLTAFWGFVLGMALAIAGGLQGRRQ